MLHQKHDDKSSSFEFCLEKCICFENIKWQLTTNIDKMAAIGEDVEEFNLVGVNN